MTKILGHNLKTWKNIILRPRARHVSEGFYSYTTPAQISAFSDAWFDKLTQRKLARDAEETRLNDLLAPTVPAPAPAAHLDLGGRYSPL